MSDILAIVICNTIFSDDQEKKMRIKIHEQIHSDGVLIMDQKISRLVLVDMDARKVITDTSEGYTVEACVGNTIDACIVNGCPAGNVHCNYLHQGICIHPLPDLRSIDNKLTCGSYR